MTNSAWTPELGVLGSGRMGTRLAAMFAKAGRRVILGSRDFDRASAIVDELAIPTLRAGCYLDAVRAPAILPAHAYEGLIREAAAIYRVDSHLIRSIMQAESAFDASAVSRVGAMGLMQLMPDVAEALGVVHPFDPRENIMGGARLLRELLDQHHGNVKLAVASYNAGPTAVAAYGGVPPFRETQGYVKKVTELIAEARRAGDGN